SLGTRGQPRSENVELGGGKGLLHQWKDLPFLEPDVGGEDDSKLLKGRDRGSGRDEFRVATNDHVLDQHPDDRRLVGPTVPGVGRQQDVLLQAEVRLAVGVPERKEGVRRARRSSWGRLSQRARDDERVVVIAGELGESRVAFHAVMPRPLRPR
ncbi:MAG: hypothetical protein ABI950_07145, partial [Solirubrobacteraceae bacterium]